MKKEMLLVGIISLLLLISGCGLTETKYVCPDGTIVENIEDCKDIEDIPIDEEDEIDLEEPDEIDYEEDDYISTIRVKEGELVSLRPIAEDPDGDPLRYAFTPPLNTDGQWQTQMGDAGTYEIDVVVSDGELEDVQTVLLIVERVNRPPVIEIEDEIIVREGERVVLEPVVTDPDGDEVTVEFSGWMNTSTYQTDFGDAGEYTVTISASDGIDTTEADVTIIVEKVNRPPRILDVVLVE